MEHPKLKLVFYEDPEGTQSYMYLEKSEGLRAIEILKILPQLKQWTPASKISEAIGSRLPATQSTIYKLAGASRINLKLPDKTQKIIAQKPILYVQKKQYNTRNNLKKQKYLRPTLYVKSPN